MTERKSQPGRDVSAPLGKDHSRNDAWSVGPVHVVGRAVLAPMAGVTDAGMRRAAQAFGAAFTVSEMVAATGLARGDTEQRIRSEGLGASPHVVQIAGCRAADLAEAARLSEASGAAWIDINMGCPAKRVTGGEAGSALMRDLGQAVALIRATVAAVRVPVTVKMRLGWDDATRNAPELARRAEAEGVAMVTVHGRTRCQFYRGRADWGAVREVVEAVRIPVVVNGDGVDAESAAAMLARSGATAVMIGRAAVGRPWLVGEIAGFLAAGISPASPPLHVRAATALGHYRWLLDTFGVEKGMRHARKHVAAYLTHAVAAPAHREVLRQRLVTSTSPAEVMAGLNGAFAESHGELGRVRAA